MGCTANKVLVEKYVCPNSPSRLSVERVAEARLPTAWGDFRIAGYRSLTSTEEFVVLYKGELRPDVPTLVRIHSQCLTGDVFGSTKCDCGEQLHRTMQMIEEEGADTVGANEPLGLAVDSREYRQCAEVLFDLGLCKVKVISNNPGKLKALQDAGLEIVERVSIEVEPSEMAARYLQTKKDKMGHLLDLQAR